MSLSTSIDKLKAFVGGIVLPILLHINTVVGTGVVGLGVIFLFIFFVPGAPKVVSNYTGQGQGKDYQYPSHETDDVVFLDQGWNEGFRHQYYYTPQGSQIIPLDMALALEGPERGTYFFGENGLSVTQYGYLPYPKTPDDETGKIYKHNLNPYGLPIGFTVDGYVEKLSQLNHKITQPMLGMNCAACHTSNMEISGKTVRIEGNQAMGDFMGLFTAMDDALAQTYSENARFKRFKTRLDNVRKDLDLEVESDEIIRDKLAGVVRRREAWQRRNTPDITAGIKSQAATCIWTAAIAAAMSAPPMPRSVIPCSGIRRIWPVFSGMAVPIMSKAAAFWVVISARLWACSARQKLPRNPSIPAIALR